MPYPKEWKYDVLNRCEKGYFKRNKKLENDEDKLHYKRKWSKDSIETFVDFCNKNYY